MSSMTDWPFGLVVELVAKPRVGAPLDERRRGEDLRCRGRHEAVVLAVEHEGRDPEPAGADRADALLLGQPGAPPCARCSS